MGRRVRLLALGLATVAVGTLTACGGGGGSTQGSTPGGSTTAAPRQVVGRTSTFAAELSTVSAPGGTTDYVEYLDLAGLRAIGVISGSSGVPSSHHEIAPNWTGVANSASGQLPDYAAVLTKVTGLDLYSADTAVTAGSVDGDGATRLTGRFDANTLTRTLTALGGRPRTIGTTPGLSFGTDGVAEHSSKLAVALAYQNPFTQFVVQPSTVVVGTDVKAVPALLRVTSAPSPTFRSLAGCLGDVVAGAIGEELLPNARTAVFAIGVRRPTTSTGPQHEIVCDLPRPGEHAAVAGAFSARLRPSATDPVSGTPLAASIASATVSSIGSVVRADLVTKPGARVDGLYTGYNNAAEIYWDGSCTLERFHSPGPGYCA